MSAWILAQAPALAYGLGAKASTVSSAVIDFKNARIIELLGPELKRRVLADPDALAAAARKVPPFAVLRAFEGVVTGSTIGST